MHKLIPSRLAQSLLNVKALRRQIAEREHGALERASETARSRHELASAQAHDWSVALPQREQAIFERLGRAPASLLQVQAAQAAAWGLHEQLQTLEEASANEKRALAEAREVAIEGARKRAHAARRERIFEHVKQRIDTHQRVAALSAEEAEFEEQAASHRLAFSQRGRAR
jgi:hypothetical protein